MPSAERLRNQGNQLPENVRSQIDAFKNQGNAILHVTLGGVEVAGQYSRKYLVWYVPHTTPGFDSTQARFYFPADGRMEAEYLLAQHSPDLTPQVAESTLAKCIALANGNVDAPEIKAAGFTIFHSEVKSFE